MEEEGAEEHAKEERRIMAEEKKKRKNEKRGTFVEMYRERGQQHAHGTNETICFRSVSSMFTQSY